MSRRGVIERECKSTCEYCGQTEELRPYGLNGERICFHCAMKPQNKEITERRFCQHVLGEKLDS